MRNLFDLSGKRALITGSAQGIGHLLAGGLAEYGAEIVINDRTQERADQAAQALVAQGFHAVGVAFDVTRAAQVEQAIARIEEEIGAMEPAEKQAFLTEMGIGQSGLDRLIQASYRLLGLISFLTAGADECRAWTITEGTRAPQAAGKIHTDFERGFIRAEIVAYDDLIAQGGMNACKEKGLVRSEGKEYVMQDGDVTLFRFNV